MRLTSASDSSIYDPSLSSVETLTLSSSGGIYRTTYGPAFFDSLKLLPQTTEFVLCLNFGNDTLEIAADQATAGVQELGGRLVALESECCAARFSHLVNECY